MKRILVIGGPGSGKSTFSRRLAEQLELPLIHLDQLYWRDDWAHCSREEFDQLLQQELDKPQWIIDGNFNRTIPHRLSFCDTVFYFDLPTIVQLWGVTQRILSNYGKTRPDMGGNCVERFDKQKPEFYKSILNFNRQHRKNYYAMLENTPDVDVIVFKSRRQSLKFLKTL